MESTQDIVSSEDDEKEFSPPTSPVHCVNSPQTSPLHLLSAESSCSSSDESSPFKRGQYNMTCVGVSSSRSVLLRHRVKQQDCSPRNDHFSSEGANSEEEVVVELPLDQHDENSAADSDRDLLHAAPTEHQVYNVPVITGMDISSSDTDDSSLEQNDDSSSAASDSVDSCDDGDLQSEASCHLDSDTSVSAHEEDSDSDECNVYLYEGSDMKTKEALLQILKLYIEERWTKKSIDKNIQLIRKLLPQPNNLPSSGKVLFRMLEKMTGSYEEKSYYYCSKCKVSKTALEETCTNCGSEKSGTFYHFPIEEQVKHMFEHRDLASVIESYRLERVSQEGHICDVLDGTEYCKIKENLPGDYDLVLIWNTDGVSLSSSSKLQLWGILSVICEVPPRLRPSFLVVNGIFVDEFKPPMNMFLKPFVDSLKDIVNNGGITWTHPKLKTEFSSKVVAPVLCADAPATAMVLNVMQYNARFGCNVCEQKTVKVVVNANEIALDPSKKRKTKRYYLFQEDEARLRTGARMELQGLLAEERGKTRKGVVGCSVVSDIPFFDRAMCIGAEYMHKVMLGTVKYLLGKMLFENKGPWYVGDKTDNMNNFLLTAVKVPDYVKRLPRTFSDFKYFKASELRSFLLYYSLPTFCDHLPERYLQHWLLLVGAMFILLSDKISDNDLKAALIMLRCFVRDISELYNDQCYTYNVHNLLHLCLLVERWGPLWATSAFAFETYNGFINAHIHGTKLLGKELVNNIKIIQNVAVLENLVNAEQIQPARGPAIPADIIVLGKPLNHELLQNEKLAFKDANIGEHNSLYGRVRVISETYTSKNYDMNMKRANSYVQFSMENSLRFGQVWYYIKVENGSVFCLINVFQVKHVNIFFHLESRFKLRHLIPVEESETLVVLPVNCLVQKLMKVGGFLCMRPNPYEVNL